MIPSAFKFITGEPVVPRDFVFETHYKAAFFARNLWVYGAGLVNLAIVAAWTKTLPKIWLIRQRIPQQKLFIPGHMSYNDVVN